jgi:hypothetical protein
VLTMEKSLCPKMEEMTLVLNPSKRSDESIDLPMEGDANLIIQVKQKNGNKTLVCIVYILKIVEMN